MSFVWMSLSENTHMIACERRVRKTHKKKEKKTSLAVCRSAFVKYNKNEQKEKG